MIVPRALTPVPLAGLADWVSDAHEAWRGWPVSDAAAELAVAQLKLEHGTQAGSLLRGVWCYNLGNHDATRADIEDPSVPLFRTLPEHEGDAASTQTQVHMRRAYPDLQAGLVGYWEALFFEFFAAYDALTGTADPDAFAAALKSARYYTADAAVYARDLRELLAAG